MSGIKANGKPSDRQDSTCKACGLGIFNKQPRVWRSGQRPGLVHLDCDDPNGSPE